MIFIEIYTSIGFLVNLQFSVNINGITCKCEHKHDEGKISVNVGHRDWWYFVKNLTCDEAALLRPIKADHRQ